MTASFGRSGRASIRILGRKKARAPSQADSRQQPVHSGIGDLASRLVFGNAAERRRAFGSPSVLQKLFHAVESRAFEGDIGTQLGEIATANPEVAIGSHPFFDPQRGANTNVVLRARDAQKLALAKRAVEDMLDRVRGAQSSGA
jgi:hypothetical protein